MKKSKIEIQVTLLTICIAIAVTISGYLAYQSLSKIVDTIHNEARPDLKLLLIKDIATDLSQVENTIRLYSLTTNPSFLRSYRQLGDSIQKKLKTLSEYSVPGSEEISHIDSISLLANRKLQVWDRIRALNRTKTNAHDTFSNLYSKIDTAIIQPDTIRFKPEPKKSFFKRLFGKRDTTTKKPVIIDKSKEKEIIKKEIAGVEEQITSQAKRLQSSETALFKQNIKLTQALNRHIASLENSEQKRLENKTQEADSMAAKTYRGMAIFTVAAVFLLIIILILFFRNLQKNRIYQQVLKQAKAEAESLAKAKEMFVATVSHEMRTPINAIYGLTGQMLQKTGSFEVTNDLKVVHRSAEHLIALVNDTLDFSKIESQKLKIEQVDFLPDEILNEIHILHKDSAQKKGIDLIINNKTDKNLVLQGDPIRLKQVLINLITNAIKFTNKGQVALTISGEEISGRTYKLHIEVLDTGVGIDEEDLKLIFDEFVQLGTDLTQKQRGAGLGLSIVKKLVLLQDGEINVESTPGMGTRFILMIPYRPGNPENIVKIQAEQIQIPGWFRNLHFLIVDDEEYNLYLIKNILNKWNVAFKEAFNGQEAVDLAAKHEYDLVLMDIRMPVMDGYEAAKQILRRNSSTRIIALTATTKAEDIQQIEQAGMHDFLQKPFAESDLINTILKLIPEKAVEIEPEKIAKEVTIDFNELERISGGDVAFRNEMLRIFIRSSEEALTKFQQNLQIFDWTALAETAHKLAAPAKHMQATTLYDHLKKLENTVENMPPEEIKKLIGSIEAEINSINSILKQKLGDD
jgi:signal transduction histidine kinase/CheY-like chemotaxis protein/HPt (histidine-containing phosphotransfer) domain-containing protein